MTGEQTPFWTIDGAGLESGKITASLTFEITHSGNIGGVKAVTRSLTYRESASLPQPFRDREPSQAQSNFDLPGRAWLP